MLFSLLFRLATKLLRLVAEQKRDLPTAAQRHNHDLESMVQEQQQQIRELQQSNGQLQDRVMVLRNQLMEHAYMHSAVHCNWMRKSHSSSRSPIHSITGTYMSSSRMRTAVSSHSSQK
jgi:predicted RNase H-like nuclease (RuvC/YqgF family)